MKSTNRPKSIKNGVYDAIYEAIGLPVDPHLRIFVARGDNGNYYLQYYIFSKLAYNCFILRNLYDLDFPCSRRSAMNNLENQIDQGASYLTYNPHELTYLIITYIWIVALFVFQV